MSTYTLKGRITKDHKLEVDVPEDALPGDAEVLLTPLATDEGKPPRGSAAAMLAALEEIRRMPDRPRQTKDEIDAELNAMRNEWDND